MAPKASTVKRGFVTIKNSLSILGDFGAARCKYLRMGIGDGSGAGWVSGIVITLAAAGYLACGGSAARDGSQSGGASGGSSSGAAGIASFAGSVNASGAGAVSVGGASSGAGGMSGGAAGAGGCTPTPLGDWKPTWVPPARPTPGVCSADQLATELELCVAPATFDQSACDAFRIDHANTSCLSCIFTPASDSTVGAVSVDAYNFWQTNLGGCMAEVDGDATANGCGAKEQAYSDCLRTACEANCWVGQGTATFDACEAQARVGECQGYLTAAVCATAPKYAECLAYMTFPDFFNGISNLFCGAGFDAGTGEGGASSNAAGAPGE